MPQEYNRPVTALEKYGSQTVEGPTTQADDAYDTFTYSVEYARTDLWITLEAAEISFRYADLTTWGPGITATLGWHSWPFVNTGIRIRNLVAGANCRFQIIEQAE